jgi:AcrR family transcriptional regulator
VAACTVLARGELTGVTIEAVVAQAGVARGSFYRYYPDVAALLTDTGRVVAGDIIDLFEPEISVQADDPARQIATGLRGVLQAVERVPAVGHLITRAGWPWLPVDGRHPLLHTVAADLDEGIRLGRFDVGSVEIATDIVVGMVLGAGHRIITRHGAERTSHDAPDLITVTVRACLRALGIPPDEATSLSHVTVDLPQPAAGSLLSVLLGSG